MKHLGSIVLLGAAAFAAPLWSQGGSAPAPTNKLPNPYETVENYFKMPDGRAWGSTSAVAVDKDGKSIWVAERCGANSCAGSKLPPVLHFDETGNLIKAFGEGLILSPHGIYVDRDGNVWVIDCACTGGGGRGRAAAPPADGAPPAAPAPAPAAPAPPIGHQIFKFSPDGKVLMTLGKPGGARDPNFFYQPNNMVIAKDGTIFVSEGHSSAPGSTARVLKLSKDGALIRSFGKLGTGPDEFDQPHALALDSKGRLFVGDRNNNRIQIFDQDFTLLDTWTQFSRPSGIVIDKNDVMYVADSESESISRGSNNNMHGHEGWKRGIRIGSAKDGSVKYFIPDPVDQTTTTSAAEGVAVDAAGNIYGAEVGPKALKKYVLRFGGEARRPGEGCVSPVEISHPRPDYTQDAMRAKLEGDVEVEAVVRKDGSVDQVRIAKSLDQWGLDSNALRAARRWRFKPATCQGIPVDMVIKFAIEFRLHEQPVASPSRVVPIPPLGVESGD